MKKTIWIFLMLFSPAVFAQQNSGWTPEQQEQFRMQMDQFKQQMEQQMESLRDSLQQMQEHMKDYTWSQFDSMQFEFPEMPEIPEMPEVPEMPEMPSMPPSDEGSEEGTNNDSTEIHVGKWKMVVHGNTGGEDHVRVYKDEESSECDKENENDKDNENELKNVETKFMLLDVGLNNYFVKNFSSAFPDGFTSFDPVPGKSWVVNIHAVDQRLNLIHYHLWLTYGAYFELNSYKYTGDNVLIPKVDSVQFATSDVTLKKNKFSCEYVGIPLTLRFESHPSHLDKSFHISAGVFGEYLLGAHTKTKTSSDTKSKQHDDFNLNRFRYGITGRVGYGWVNVFTNISLSELFESGAGPVFYPVSAGLAFEF